MDKFLDEARKWYGKNYPMEVPDQHQVELQRKERQKYVEKSFSFFDRLMDAQKESLGIDLSEEEDDDEQELEQEEIEQEELEDSDW